METTGVDDTQCCYAAKTETWITGPDDARWEWYVKTGDTEQFASISVGAGTDDDASCATGGGSCCS